MSGIGEGKLRCRPAGGLKVAILCGILLETGHAAAPAGERFLFPRCGYFIAYVKRSILGAGQDHMDRWLR
jgi:hypothetical protein